MPAYDYLCDGCGAFTASRPMAEFAASQPCPGCGDPAPRALLVAPSFAMMDGGTRRAHATNERSANVPTKGRKHPASCGCCKPAARGLKADAVPAAKSFPGARPWMISH